MKYRGVTIPDVLIPNWNDSRVEVAWWKRGVDSALDDNWAGPGFTARNDESTT